jgi:hypothetical protein
VMCCCLKQWIRASFTVSKFSSLLDLGLDKDAHPDWRKTRSCTRTESIGFWDHVGYEVGTGMPTGKILGRSE